MVSSALAERPPDKREEAGVVVKCRVERIVKTRDGENDNFIIHLRVETVGRGTGATVGELFSVSIWRWVRKKPGYVDANGHKGRPRVGDQVRVFAYKYYGAYNGNYPSCYDELQPGNGEDVLVDRNGSIIPRPSNPSANDSFLLVLHVAYAVLALVGGAGLVLAVYKVWRYHRLKRFRQRED